MNKRRPGHDPRRLNRRELDIACLIARGKRNREIAELLKLSVLTVETHIKNIFRKLNVQSRTELARWFIEHDS